jgi:hypothetical protein
VIDTTGWRSDLLLITTACAALRSPSARRNWSRGLPHQIHLRSRLLAQPLRPISSAEERTYPQSSMVFPQVFPMDPNADSSGRQAASASIRKTPLPLTAWTTVICRAMTCLAVGSKAIAAQWPLPVR